MESPQPPNPTDPLPALQSLIRQAENADENLKLPVRLRIHSGRLRGTAALLDRAATIIEQSEAMFVRTLERLTATEKELADIKPKIGAPVPDLTTRPPAA